MLLSYLPASLLQEEAWRCSDGRMSNDNVAFAWRIRGQLDQHAFIAAVELVAAKHEALRTSLAETADGVSQLISPGSRIRVETVDLQGSSSQQRRAKLRAMQVDAAAPFMLSGPSLARLTLLRFAPDLHLAAWVIHHVVFDGASRRLLLDEVTEEYRAPVNGPAPAGEGVELQFADYSMWERTRRSETSEQFWRNTLALRPHRAALPYRHGRTETDVLLISRVPLTVIPAGVMRRLGDLAASHGASLAMVLGTAAAYAVGSSDPQEVMLRVLLSGRDRPETRSVIGCLINFLPVRVSLGRNETPERLLDRVRDSWVSALTHELPFPTIHRLCTDQATRAAEMFDCGLNFTPYVASRPDRTPTSTVGFEEAAGVAEPACVRLSGRYAAAIHLEYILFERLDGSARGYLAVNRAALSWAAIASTRDRFQRAVRSLAKACSPR